MMQLGRDRATALTHEEIEVVKICQGIIERMAGSSARVKSYFFIISSAFVALLGSEVVYPSWQLLLGYGLIAAVMWFTDARYLQLEQQFRGLHWRIIQGNLPNLDKWGFSPWKKDGQSVLRLMFWNFSTAMYPLTSLGLLLLASSL